jgi:hypothetical protein
MQTRIQREYERAPIRWLFFPKQIFSTQRLVVGFRLFLSNAHRSVYAGHSVGKEYVRNPCFEQDHVGLQYVFIRFVGV